jgi:hypothetical protein
MTCTTAHVLRTIGRVLCSPLSAIAIIAVATLQITAAQTKSSGRDVDVERLLPWLEGTFTNHAQHLQDTTVSNDTLHIKRMWHDRTDGAWFYVEYRSESGADKPKRQLVYNVRRVEQGMIEQASYRIKQPDRVAGAWADTTRLQDLTPAGLVKRRGCEVFLQADFGQYLGRTMGMACGGDTYGVSYVTVDVTIKYDRIVIWERGFNTSNEQVTGGTVGPSIFQRLTPLPFGVEKD